MKKEWKQISGTDVLEWDSGRNACIPEAFGEQGAGAAHRFHKSIPGYQETPLVPLQQLAKQMGVKAVYVKDESRRFSLKAFKGLGGSYAMFRILCEKFGLDPERTLFQDLVTEEMQKKIGDITFVTATDGNHGRGVSWAAGLFGCRAHVYMPAGSAEARAEAIRQAGPAEVRITDMNYDDTVRFAMEQSREKGWHLIQDTAWEGYEQIPTWIIQGYMTMMEEVGEQMEGVRPTHVFLQAGVGAMAGGVTGYLAQRYGEQKPVITIVEPDVADCIYLSAETGDGNPHSVEGSPSTIMAGLNCGTPCKVTWPALRDKAEFYMACPDETAARGMRIYANPEEGDQRVVSGESGAATMGALDDVARNPEFHEVREAMGLDSSSIVLLINTEGDTDPQGYRDIIEGRSF